MSDPKDIKIDGKKQASELLASLDETSRERILGEITKQDPGLAATLRRGMYTFKQVTAEPIEVFSQLMKTFREEQWALALKPETEDTRTALLSKFPSRFKAGIVEQLSLMGPRKRSDCIQMQEKIADFTRALVKK